MLWVIDITIFMLRPVIKKYLTIICWGQITFRNAPANCTCSLHFLVYVQLINFSRLFALRVTLPTASVQFLHGTACDWWLGSVMASASDL